MTARVADVISWYVAQLKPNAAQIAERNLHRQGFRTFMPLIERDDRRSPGFQRRLRPLFPGYLFVGFDPVATGWRPIGGTRGIARLVVFGSDAPRAVSPALIETLRCCTGEDGIFRTGLGLSQGDSVVIMTGPFADFCARIQSLDDSGRAWVLLDLLGQETRVQLHRDQLARRA